MVIDTHCHLEKEQYENLEIGGKGGVLLPLKAVPKEPGDKEAPPHPKEQGEKRQHTERKLHTKPQKSPSSPQVCGLSRKQSPPQEFRFSQCYPANTVGGAYAKNVPLAHFFNAAAFS